jgi:polyhydroxybutyrate depolymerase
MKARQAVTPRLSLSMRACAGAAAVVAVAAVATGCSSSSSGGAPSAQTLAVTPAVVSAGCQGGAAPSGRTDGHFVATNGKSGDYTVAVPAAAAGKPLPLVFELHGYLEPAVMVDQGSRLSNYGMQQGFITVLPELDESGPPRWATVPNSPDVAWISELLTHLESKLCVDERRVYSTGLSMGATMSSTIACELSSRIAAVAPIAGVQAYTWCKPQRAVPVVAFHGTADPYIAYTGGPGPEGMMLPAPGHPGKTVGQVLKEDPGAAGIIVGQSIPGQVATWAKRNGCSTPAANTTVTSDVTLIAYPCPADASVELYRVKAGGHTWPGGVPGIYPGEVVGHMTHSISADKIMWAFFKAHPLTGPIGS